MELQQDENSIELSDDTSMSEMNACNSADDVNLALECDDDDSLQTTQDGTHGRHQAVKEVVQREDGVCRTKSAHAGTAAWRWLKAFYI
jgi:hypothetical protein